LNRLAPRASGREGGSMRGPLPQRIAVALAAGLAFAAAGCDPFTRLDFTLQTELPSGDRLDYGQMRIDEGRAVGFIATPMQGSDKMADDTDVRLETRNADVAGIGPSLENHTFVVFGVSKGSTSLRVIIDDNFEDEIPVDVVEAP
jgi:hypothetical protein